MARDRRLQPPRRLDAGLFPGAGLLVTAAVVLLPVAQTVWLSLQDYILYDPDARDLRRPSELFARSSPIQVFWISLRHSAVWIVGVVGLQFLLGLAAALLLNESFWWRGLARALVIVPWALPSVIIGLMWTWMYDYNLGVINDILMRTGHRRRAGRLAGAARHSRSPRSCWR